MNKITLLITAFVLISCDGFFSLDTHEQFMENVCECKNSWDESGEIFSKKKQAHLQVCERIMDGEPKFGFVWDNNQCEIFIPFIYKSAGSFKNFHAPVKMDNLWGVIDSTGKLKLDYQFHSKESARDSIKNLMLSQAIDTIWSLTKVQTLNDQIDSLSSGSRHLTVLTIDEQNQYRIKLAEDNGSNFVTHLTFFIDLWNNWTIYYYDPLTDKKIAIDYWN